ncbi:major tail protein [Mammaliicoccus vitulinus]|uniref:major tail protein n=1 Tax=Mammaliicoccus vitulinus TaxID=71237 RepID=UPI0039B02857
MQTFGFKRLLVGVFDKDGLKVEKKLVWEDENGGTVNLNVTGLNPESVKFRASNKTVWQKRQGTDEVKSDMDLFNVPTEDLNTVLGRDSDGKTSWVGDDTRAPYVAMIGESENPVTGEPIYCALTKGTFGLESIEMKTTEEKIEAPEPLKLAGDWIGRNIDGKSRTIGFHEGTEGADEFIAKVFDGLAEEEPVKP